MQFSQPGLIAKVVSTCKVRVPALLSSSPWISRMGFFTLSASMNGLISMYVFWASQRVLSSDYTSHSTLMNRVPKNIHKHNTWWPSSIIRRVHIVKEKHVSHIQPQYYLETEGSKCPIVGTRSTNTTTEQMWCVYKQVGCHERPIRMSADCYLLRISHLQIQFLLSSTSGFEDVNIHLPL